MKLLFLFIFKSHLAFKIHFIFLLFSKSTIPFSTKSLFQKLIELLSDSSVFSFLSLNTKAFVLGILKLTFTQSLLFALSTFSVFVVLSSPDLKILKIINTANNPIIIGII